MWVGTDNSYFLMTNFLVRILTLAAFSLLFPSLWGCSIGGTPQNLISNGSFEGDIKGWSIGQNANTVLTHGNPQSFFLKKIFSFTAFAGNRLSTN